MCSLYEKAPALDCYQAEEVPEGVRVFFWNAGSREEPEYKLIAGGVPDRKARAFQLLLGHKSNNLV